MYAAMLVFSLATPLMLGSVWGLMPGLIFIIVLARRAVLEERMLQDALPGYKEYMTQVKYRLIPFVW
jgi:protein-S-isoprenylcysteine O-methyltransferase Ste14